MDSVSSEVMFSVNHLRSTVDDPTAPWQLLLKIVADFAVSIESTQFYAECEFPVVEFASQAAKWLRDDTDSFFFISMESEDEPLLGFYRNEAGHFRASSPHQTCEPRWDIEPSALRAALQSFIHELMGRVASELGLNLSEVL